MILRIIELTIVVSAMDPKLLMKMLQVTFTGGPVEGEKREKQAEKTDSIREFLPTSKTENQFTHIEHIIQYNNLR